jgi:hypothetical protein
MRLEQVTYVVDLRRRSGDGDQVDNPGGHGGPDGVHEERLIGEQAQRLGRTRTEPVASAGGGHDARGGHGSSAQPSLIT